MFIKEGFPLFWANLCGFRFKVCKNWLWMLVRPQKNYFWKIKKDVKKRWILCWFKTVEKVTKKMHAQNLIEKNVIEKCTFSTSTLVHQIDFLLTFCVCIFLQLFQPFWKQHKILRFSINYLIFSKIIFLLSYWQFNPLFANFEAKSAQNAQKTEKTPLLNRC